MGVAYVKEHSLKKRRMNKYDFQQFQMIVKIRETALFTRAMPGFSLVINKINNRIIGWEPGVSRTGPLGSGSRVGADRVGYQESSNTLDLSARSPTRARLPFLASTSY